MAGAAQAADVTVRVAGPLEVKGVVGCALFAGARGFPMDNSGARMMWLPVQAQGVTCAFRYIPGGTYAVSVLQDLNGNQVVDTNVSGMPQEPWGVSNNVRPTLRPPRFDETAFNVDENQGRDVQIRVAP